MRSQYLVAQIAAQTERAETQKVAHHWSTKIRGAVNQLVLDFPKYLVSNYSEKAILTK
jgi:hypothetical protein